ncbi:MAG: hypothetical protein IPG71_13220 [bacterium]|nr:hypothetical protein [bacterium]
MKREIPILITLVFGVFMIVQFFIPHPVVNEIANRLQNWAIIVISFSYVLGSANILRINGELVYRRGPGWLYKLVLVIAFFLMVIPGMFFGIAEGTWTNDYLFTYTYVPLASTMYASLAFYIASAAFRAFRSKDVASICARGYRLGSDAWSDSRKPVIWDDYRRSSTG